MKVGTVDNWNFEDILTHGLIVKDKVGIIQWISLPSRAMLELKQ
jgi:hypothetical protein